jgi:hypothetical protein
LLITSRHRQHRNALFPTITLLLHAYSLLWERVYPAVVQKCPCLQSHHLAVGLYTTILSLVFRHVHNPVQHKRSYHVSLSIHLCEWNNLRTMWNLRFPW